MILFLDFLEIILIFHFILCVAEVPSAAPSAAFYPGPSAYPYVFKYAPVPAAAEKKQ